MRHDARHLTHSNEPIVSSKCFFGEHLGCYVPINLKHEAALLLQGLSTGYDNFFSAFRTMREIPIPTTTIHEGDLNLLQRDRRFSCQQFVRALAYCLLTSPSIESFRSGVPEPYLAFGVSDHDCF